MSLQNASPKILEYELSSLDKAIEKVSAVLLKYADHPHAYEYYSAMQECLLALDGGLREMQETRRAYENLYIRLENLELVFHHYLKEKSK